MVATVTGFSSGAARTQHLAESGLSVSSELIFVQFPQAILYFINVPICQCKYSSGRRALRLVSADTDSASFCAILEAYSLQCSFHCSSTLETAARCETYLLSISMWTEPFLLQTRDSCQYPKFHIKALEWGGGTRREAWLRCALGEETPCLSRKQNQESSCNLFIESSKGNLSCSSR